MPKKPAVRFVCEECGESQGSWSGRCPQCGQWNSLVEEAVVTSSRPGQVSQGSKLKPSAVGTVTAKTTQRLISGLADVDEVLGGGVVPGSINLLAGQPGIGKSTLLLQLANDLAKNAKVLYVSGEESEQQVALRANRLGIKNTNLQLASSTSADDIAATITGGRFQVVVVDSIQAVSVQSVTSAPGSVSQITNSANLITGAAKQADTAVILVGHVTKEGSIAGPKVLEHMVDVVLQLEGDRYGGFKILRAVKNRYGSTNQSAIFEMENEGLKIVTNPSAALLAERQVTDGSVVFAAMEGNRPLLVEVQALVNKTSYGYPKRAASGIDLNRLNLLVAMLERRTKLKLFDQDIYINIVGGLKISEPAADLAVCLAIGSAAKGLKLADEAVVFGEVGLSGEVRHVPHIDKRLKEAKKLGFDYAIGPKFKGKTMSNLKSVNSARDALNQFLKS